MLIRDTETPIPKFPGPKILLFMLYIKQSANFDTCVIHTDNNAPYVV